MLCMQQSLSDLTTFVKTVLLNTRRAFIIVSASQRTFEGRHSIAQSVVKANKEHYEIAN